MTQQEEYKRYLDFAVKTARGAGKILLSMQKDRLNPIYTTPTNFKSAADDTSDNYINQRIQREFPDHSIYSEESKWFKKTDSEYTWVCDALDGTIGYVYDITDHYTVSIALVSGTKPVVGVLYAPKRGTLYAAAEGLGAAVNGWPISVSDVTDINKVLMGIDSGKKKGMRASHLLYLAKLMQDDGITCPFMTACATVPLAFVAEGKMHAYLATALEPEDMAAAVCIIREAGGMVTDLAGKEWDIDEMSILAANPVLHRKLMEFLNSKSQIKFVPYHNT